MQPTTIPAIIKENDYYRIEHAQPCTIPGYLIIFVKPTANHLGELAPAIQQAVCQAISSSLTIVKSIIQPERIYTLSFGEQTPQLHFHIFPRTRQMLNDYNQALQQHNDYADGATMFNWARKHYQQTSQTDQTLAAAITAAFKSSKKNDDQNDKACYTDGDD